MAELEEDGDVTMKIKGVSPLKQMLSWIFLGKRLLRDEKYSLFCSRCNTKMDKIQKKEIIIDICPRCGGMFLDNGEINKLVSISKKGEKKNGSKKK